MRQMSSVCVCVYADEGDPDSVGHSMYLFVEKFPPFHL